MGIGKAVLRGACGAAFLTVLYAVQRPFHQYPGVEYRTFELTPDWEEKTEWAFARLMFPPGANDGYRGRFYLSGPRIIRAPIAISPRRCAA